MSDTDLDLEVHTITLQLQQLRVEQERLERRLTQVQTKLQRGERGLADVHAQGAIGTSCSTSTGLLSQNVKQNQDRRKLDTPLRQERPYTKQTEPTRGDQVRILNPQRGQDNTRVIIGFCTDRIIKILTDKNIVITRLPKNVYYYI